GVAGNEDITPELRRITLGRTVNQRPISIRSVSQEDSLAGIHLLYIGPANPVAQAVLLQAAQDLPIVTVTNGDDGQVNDSAIQFKEVDGRIRFEVSLTAVERCGCRFSARMLSVALRVHPVRIR